MVDVYFGFDTDDLLLNWTNVEVGFPLGHVPAFGSSLCNLILSATEGFVLCLFPANLVCSLLTNGQRLIAKKGSSSSNFSNIISRYVVNVNMG
jgi:hypothetical protein